MSTPQSTAERRRVSRFVCFFASALIALQVGAAESPEGHFEFAVVDRTITITGYKGPGGDVVIPSTINLLPVTRIAGSAFINEIGLTSVIIPDSVTFIGRIAFAGCTSLTYIVIPNSVTTIGESAFWGCTGLASITIPDSVTTIGAYAFLRCTGLTEVTIPDSVTTIGAEAFRECTGLTSIDVDEFNMTYSSVDGVLFDKNQTTLIQYPLGRSGHYSIPDSVTSIGVGAFGRCTDLTSIVIPNSVTSIGAGAFRECDNLNYIVIPESVTRIGEMAFFFCAHLTRVYFKGLPPRVGNFVFEGNDNVTVYYLPGTEGWSSAFGGRPTALWILPLRILTDSGLGVKPEGFTFTISWGTEEPIVVEAITDLSGSDWVTLYSGPVTGGSVEITDPDWHQHRARLYRARVTD